MINCKDNDTCIAYIAGLFDGEGNIMINKVIKNKKTYYFLSINITNVNLDSLEYVKKIFNIGSISIGNRKRKNNHRVVYKLRIYSNEASFFLEKILPFLIIKKEQALLAIDFQKRLLCARLTPEELNIRQSIKNKISNLNLFKIKNID